MRQEEEACWVGAEIAGLLVGTVLFYAVITGGLCSMLMLQGMCHVPAVPVLRRLRQGN